MLAGKAKEQKLYIYVLTQILFHLAQLTMKQNILISFLLFCNVAFFGQQLHVKTFGDKKAKPVILLHGGPGYNSAAFEAITAQRLADSGFFVVSYDRRGEGRSLNANAAYTFQQTFDDLNFIYQSLKLKKATLMGASFGGIVAILYANHFPEKVNSVILIGAPIAMQESLRNILNSSEKISRQKQDTAQLHLIQRIRSMDTASREYSVQCFQLIQRNNFFTPQNPTEERTKLLAQLAKDSLAKFASLMNFKAAEGFWKNEHYTTLDLTDTIQLLLKKKIKVFGLYGKDDKYFSEQQIKNLSQMLGKSNVNYWDRCSHGVTTDRQTDFIEALKKWTK